MDLRYQDYRDVEGRFDRVVSIGMFEAVGPKNFRTYMQTVERCLKDDGLFLLHTIGTNAPDLQADPFTIKYISSRVAIYPYRSRLMLPRRAFSLWRTGTISAVITIQP